MVEKESINLPKISVIVPVYKAETYLHRCVDSILAQTFTDWELLLIDDGSPDRSGEICDEYAQKDSRVRVIHKKNGGVSSARQRGLDESIGEYTIHADPDDWVEPGMLAEMYKKAKDEDADMVICDFYTNYKDEQRYVKQEPTALDNKTVLRNLFQHLHGSCWNKLVKRTCYYNYKVKFVEWMSFCEDLYVNTRLLQNPLKVSYLSKAFYHYDQIINDNSLVKKYSYESFEYDRKLCDFFKEKFKGSDVENLVNSNCLRLSLIRAFEGHIFTSKEFKKLFFKERKETFDCFPSRFVAIAYYLSCIGGYRIVYKLVKLLLKIKMNIHIK